MENEFEEKYRTLFRRYYAGLSFYAARLVGEDDAEDIVQDVFLEIWKRKDTVELGGQIQSFFTVLFILVPLMCSIIRLS